MRFFIDTNVIISAALFPKGKTAYLFSYILESHEVVISDYALRECQIVFERKFPEKVPALESFIEKIPFILFKTPEMIDVSKYPPIRDQKDLPILVGAILSDSDILLTGDKDFSTIDIDKPLIFTPTDYFELMDKKKP